MNKLFILIICFLFTTSFAFATSWPTGPGIEIQQQLPAGYEPSGVIWHPHYNALFLISDEGLLSKMNLDGSNVTNWSIPGDLEGITIADPNSEFVYIVTECPFNIIRFNPTNNEKTTISLTGIIPATNATNSGIEGMTFVPNGKNPYANSSNDGLFYFGIQENGTIYAVDVDFTLNTATLKGSFTPIIGGDISDLFYNTETEMLYVLYDWANLLREIKAIDNSYVNEYIVPGTEQEGIAFLPSYPNNTATLIIGEDTPTKVVKYNNFPVTYPIVTPIDSDNDGVIDDLDKCSGFDDKLDLDSDSIPDGCDAIDNRDSDNDGVINEYDTWPLGSEINIQQNLPSGFEASGIIYHPHYNALFLVSDKGTLSKMNLDGTNVTLWPLAGDLEGITIADPNSEFVYIVNEYPFNIIQFNPTNNEKKTISLTGIIPATSNNGLGIQGVAYGPEWHHQYTNIHNGLFYLGMQENGKIYVVDIDFSNNNAKLIDSFIPVNGRTDISDLFYNTETQMLYILYDNINTLTEIDNSKEIIKEYTLSNKNLDGVTVLSTCPNTLATLIITEDAGKVMKYGNYSIACQTAPIKDSDYDSVLDPYDKCSGFDDKLDLDSDSTPDGCDNSDDRDQDNDGLTNAQEIVYGTNPLLADTDNGTVLDGKEILNGTNPLNANDDVPVVIDPNAILSYTINSNATILVKYSNNTQLTIDPFTGTTKVSVGTNTKKDRLIVTNGKYVNVYKRDSLIAQKKINRSENAKATMTITNMGTYDKIIVQVPFFWFKTTSTSTLTNDVLK